MRRALIIALVCTFLTGVWGAENAFASITVSGSVVCANTGGPAKGVKVTVYCTTIVCERIPTVGYTNNSGNFSIFVNQCPFCAFDWYYEVEIGNELRCCKLDGSGSGWWTGVWYVGCPTSCFVEGTEITMADGSTKPIEDIQVGDLVLALDEKSQEMKPDKVSHVYESKLEDSHLVLNDRVRVTRSHPVLSGGEWVEVGDLRVGDSLAGADGHPELITKMELVLDPARVFNFAVNPYETFVAGGIIAHNKRLEQNAQEMDP